MSKDIILVVDYHDENSSVRRYDSTFTAGHRGGDLVM